MAITLYEILKVENDFTKNHFYTVTQYGYSLNQDYVMHKREFTFLVPTDMVDTDLINLWGTVQEDTGGVLETTRMDFVVDRIGDYLIFRGPQMGNGLVEYNVREVSFTCTKDDYILAE